MRALILALTLAAFGAAEPPKRDAPEQPKRDSSEQPKSDAPEQPKRDASEQPKSDASEQPKSDAPDQPKRDASEQPKSDAPKATQKPDFIAVPLASYNSDEKLGFGAAGGVYIYGGDTKPYRHGIAGQFYLTTGGIQSHFLRYDGPDFLGSGRRFETRLEYRRELFAPYYGPGNQSSPEFANEERSRNFSFDRFAPGGWARLRFPDASTGLEPWIGYGFRYTRVRAFEGSLLERDQPEGFDGGATGYLMAGVEHDDRDDESNSRTGGTREISLRVAGRPTFSRYDYGALTVSVRHFVPLSPRFVLAGRVVGDWQFGQVPFYEWPIFGGLWPPEGIGGTSSVRGLPRDRYVGPIKLMGNAELRATFGSLKVLGKPLDLMALVFGDAGRVWAPDVDDGPWFLFHPSGGVGFRAIRGAAVVRIDYGISRERSSIYVTVGHQF